MVPLPTHSSHLATSRSENFPGFHLLPQQWYQRAFAWSVDNEAAHNEAANEKDLPLPHIKCKSAFAPQSGRALLKWMRWSNIRSGYIFRKITLNDQVSQSDKPLNSDTFFESFRMNLLEIGRSPLPYGTHSFVRDNSLWIH
ncbi:hypothetical protein V8E54_003868 [Elaphomyces granulatus]